MNNPPILIIGSIIVSASLSQAAVTAINSAIAPATHTPNAIAAGTNTISGVTFTNNGPALSTNENIPGNTTSTFDFLNSASGSSPAGVDDFTIAFNDLHDGGGDSVLTINATTLNGDTVSLVSQEGPLGGNPSINFSQSADFQWSTSINGGPVVDSGIFIPLGQGNSSFFTFTADDPNNPIVSASFIWSSPTSPDGITFEGISFTPVAVPEPSISLLGCIALIGVLRRKRH